MTTTAHPFGDTLHGEVDRNHDLMHVHEVSGLDAISNELNLA